MLDPARPLFDVTLLGLGADGHTASLFPGTPALEERRAWATTVIGASPEPRISLTYPALESSADILFLVSGAAKKEILARVLANDRALPASRIAARGAIRIFADRAAPDGLSAIAPGLASQARRRQGERQLPERIISELAAAQCAQSDIKPAALRSCMSIGRAGRQSRGGSRPAF